MYSFLKLICFLRITDILIICGWVILTCKQFEEPNKYIELMTCMKDLICRPLGMMTWLPSQWKSSELYWHCIYILSHFSHVQLFAMLWTVAHQDSLSMGFSLQRILEGWPFSSSEDLLDPEIEPESLMSLALAGGFFTTSVVQNYLLETRKQL